MQIQCKNGVSFNTRTTWLKDSKRMVSIVTRRTGNTESLVSRQEYSTYAQSLSKVRSLAYRSACKCAEAMARNYAYIN